MAERDSSVGDGPRASRRSCRAARRVEDGLREIPPDLIEPNPRQPRRTFDQVRARRARRVDPDARRAPADRGAAAGRRQLRARRRRAPPARRADGRARADPRDRARHRRLGAARPRPRREHGARRPQRRSRRRARARCSSTISASRRRRSAAASGRSRVAISNLIRLLDLPEEALELIERGDLSEGHGRAILLCKDHATRRRLARSTRATAAGRCARPSVAHARLRVSPSLSASAHPRRSTRTWPRRWPRRRTRSRRRSAATVKVAPAWRCAASWRSTSTAPAEAVELAERMLAAGVDTVRARLSRRLDRRAPSAATSARRGRLAQSVRARL